MKNKLSSIKVSVIVPCYNQSQYLDDCLSSVINQSFEEWECIIVNDGSNDSTEEKAKQWVKKDKRIKYIYKKNGGLSDARNKGIQIASGEYILPLDADDKINKEYIEKAYLAINNNKNVGIVYSKAEKFGTEKGLLNLKYKGFKSLLIQNAIFCSGLFRKKDWARVGGYDVKMIFGLEDWEFWINILKNTNYKVIQLDYVGFLYRIKKNNSMLSELTNNKDKTKKMYSYINKKHIDEYLRYFDTIIEMHKEIVRLKSLSNDVTNMSSISLIRVIIDRVIRKLL